MSDKSEVPMESVPQESQEPVLSFTEQRRLDRKLAAEALENKKSQTLELINNGKREITVTDRKVIDADPQRRERVEAAKRYYHRLMVSNADELRSSQRARDKVPDVLRNTTTSGWIESNGEWVFVPNGINKIEDNKILWGGNAAVLEPIASGENQVNVFSITNNQEEKAEIIDSINNSYNAVLRGEGADEDDPISELEQLGSQITFKQIVDNASRSGDEGQVIGQNIAASIVSDINRSVRPSNEEAN